jgi:transcriptional regulator with XRE-family HTH domain
MVIRSNYAQLFGDRLRKLRAAAELTQRELARLTGTSAAAISNFEAGNNSPTLGTLLRLADALRCNVTDLVEVLNRRPHRSRKSRKTE